ncbi:MAG TPA: class I tRNA ligase family protein, partial [Candidatus Margulisiibacteriota bacterium]|nr:class I tRNA ligase family protein [Candidatus Margulisiibacteriota bacterium]
NVISPQDIIKDYGADILRLWVSSSDYNEDIRISKEILTRLSEAYRKIRNTAKFILSNLYDFHPDKNKVGEESFRKIDRWILARLIKMVEDAGDSYEKFQFHKAYKVIYDFCNEDLSMYYLDMVKGRLYTYAADSAQRRAAQSVLYEVLNALVRITAPLLVFTADEIWQNMPRRDFEKSISSVHLLSWPSLGKLLSPEVASAESQLKEIIALIPEAAKLLEEMRSKGLIGSSFDAKIKLLTNNEERYKFLSSLKSDLCEVFKVSQVEICREGQADIAVTASKAEGVKCVRCWNYSSGVGSAKEHPLICVNCFKAIGGKS